MKYLVEIENGVAKETLVFNGKEYTRTAKRVGSSSSFIGMDFSEQMEEEDDELSDNVLDQVYDTLDGFFVGDLLEIAESED